MSKLKSTKHSNFDKAIQIPTGSFTEFCTHCISLKKYSLDCMLTHIILLSFSRTTNAQQQQKLHSEVYQENHTFYSLLMFAYVHTYIFHIFVIKKKEKAFFPSTIYEIFMWKNRK